MQNPEQNYSPAQEAVMRVHHRIAEIGFEPGAAVVARLLLHPQQVGCLLGKGGFIINEMRRATGASIRIFPKEQVQKSVYHHDDVVQVGYTDISKMWTSDPILSRMAIRIISWCFLAGYWKLAVCTGCTLSYNK